MGRIMDIHSSDKWYIQLFQVETINESLVNNYEYP